MNNPKDLHAHIERELADKPSVWISRNILRDFVWRGLGGQGEINAKLTEFCEEHDYEHRYNGENNKFGFGRIE